ncbi:ABC transporter ATP-binding protein [Paenibacillus ginsengarvi]|uniref:Carnitine transport ATP-binding protein OpuCA n=1 Tax=Paenibacillus ginsengarvi TaxID=400777 RepID=A0A3B0CJ83_9BACL|nr:ABC transporter ATP-binding protein [Paenibacillus ginsengarvi]RKN84349.1 ATP-binding cassette domain-containing protein [Paenibacillus ginsengarvi]
MTFFEMSNITFQYDKGNESVLYGFSMQLERGELVGVLGHSGCGKSTLLRLIAGLEAPHSGRIVIGGTTMVDSNVFVGPESRGVGMVFQDYALFPHLTVENNILFGLHRLSKKDRAARKDEMLELVQLHEYAKRYPHELSGGQQQRVAFARALAPRPSILLMDEPFSNLDSGLKGKIRGELKQLLRAANITSILVTHDKEDADAICDRIVLLERKAVLSC